MRKLKKYISFRLLLLSSFVAIGGLSMPITAQGQNVCYYTDTGSACDIGFNKMPGNATFVTTSHNICCSVGDSGAAEGYFVAIPTQYNGNLGGKAGADGKCLFNLNSYDWRGKADAQAAGILTASNVKAWICDSTSCQDFKPGRNYAFAVADDTLAGGEVFTARSEGIPLPPSGSWINDLSKVAGSYMVNQYFWTGRINTTGAKFTVANENCSNWTSTGTTGKTGYTAGTKPWSFTTTACSSTYRLYCMVHPD